MITIWAGAVLGKSAKATGWASNGPAKAMPKDAKRENQNFIP
jgi:hypothetical protein